MGLTALFGDQFVDVTSSHEGDINAIAAAGVTIGCDPNGPRYCPLETVLRDQMATFLTRSRGLTPITVAPAPLYPVLSITDGDTFRASVNGISEPIRLIGIDTAETGSCLADAATAYLGSLIAGKSVRLISDVSDRDQFDRLLRYVMIGGVIVNAELVRQGLAVAVQFPPDTFTAPLLEAAQVEAQSAGRGQWGPNGGCPPPPPPSNCHPSYTGACLYVGQGDYDCAGGSGNGPNYIQGPVYVVGYDEFGLDGDNDGIGCET
jgi:endonuclease YncB( thermonuclease family)